MSACKPPLSSDWSQLQTLIKNKDLHGIRSWFNIFHVDDMSDFSKHFKGFDPVCFAIEGNEEELFDVLIQSGFPADRWVGREQAIHLAASRGRVNFLKKLIDDCEIPVDTPTKNKMTPLHIAMLSVKYSAIDFLVSRGANTKESLIWAINKGLNELLKYMISKGADVNYNCSTYGSAMFLAISKGRLDHVRTLCEAGARPDVCFKGGHTVLHGALACEADRVQIIKDLLKINWSLHAVNDKGETPVYTGLCMASENHVSLWIDLVVAAGHRLSSKDCDKAFERFPESTVMEKIKFHSEHPRSLKELCCFKIREILGLSLNESVKVLQLPKTCKDAITLSHLL